MTNAPQTCDVICSATVTAATENVRRHLLALAKVTLGLRGDFSIVYHLAADRPDELPVGLTMHDHGPLTGAAYVAAAANARIVVDLEDSTSQTARAARLAALKQVNVHLLAEDGPAARAFLPPEVLFTTPEALVDKVYAILGQSAA